MTDASPHLQKRHLTDLARRAFGPGRTLAGVDRLRGGTKKGVYRLTLDDGTTGIAYVWSAEENYWPASSTVGDPADPFAAADGIDLFLTAHSVLTQATVRVPEMILLDRDGDRIVVEDVRGGTLEALRTPARTTVLERLGATVRTLHSHRSDTYGRPGVATAPSAALPDRVLNRALRHLAASATQVADLAAVADRIEHELYRRHAAVQARNRYTLIHGELGPDHVLVDPANNPVIIDIEGVMYSDVEWEHVFLELRFGEDYRYLAADDLDLDRLRFYRLAMYLSLVEGPLWLLQGSFPDRDGMRAIADANIGNVLRDIA